MASPAAVSHTSAAALSHLIRHISTTCTADLRPEYHRLVRKVSLLSHLLDEIDEFFSRSEAGGGEGSSAPPVDPVDGLDQLLTALRAANRFLSLGRDARTCQVADSHNVANDTVPDKISVQFKYLMWQLEKALGNFPYNYFGISEEIQEQVELVRAQMKREIKKESSDVKLFSELHHVLTSRQTGDLQSNLSNLPDEHHELREIVLPVLEIHDVPDSDVERIMQDLINRLDEIKISNSLTMEEKSTTSGKSESVKKTQEKVQKGDTITIPEDFRCPISLELMRDPVIVSTGQTYERAFIQRWIDNGNRTCPKTQQKLQNTTLTPNYVLRSLIMQWCEEHGIDPPTRSKSDGFSLEVGGDRTAIESIVRSLSSTSPDDRKSAAAEIRSLAKRSTDNRILLAEAGAIPALVSLLSSKDKKTQEHAVTSLLNLSIYDHNKELIILAGAIIPIVQVLHIGSMEARENAAAAIFSLSLVDENKITIGSTPGAIEALVELLQTGSARGRKDAATALFNLCIYQANKVRAVRAGILLPLIQMLQDSSNNGTIDEALTILSVLVSHQECKLAIAKANTIPVLIDLLRSGQPRNKENAAAILLALCKKDIENLACIGRLGALIPLTELTKTGTDRAKRKATSLLEHLSNLKVM
ncbi:U-box domain-containing protein 10 [Rhynchospora pubera]|uniref:RING-type E3 ubiquitin transferase n=1 Tax=Rhynchospora pubera TaxID=906938 RepID=A0AAV8CI26_9POAL|nr:U-box domain-containing protein 10 [Rhynchospora pubera]